MPPYLRWIALGAVFSVYAAEPAKLQRLKVPAPPWPAGKGQAMKAGEIVTAEHTRAMAGAEVLPVAVGVPAAGPKKR